jgi:hypothetical protein
VGKCCAQFCFAVFTAVMTITTETVLFLLAMYIWQSRHLLFIKKGQHTNVKQGKQINKNKL